MAPRDTKTGRVMENMIPAALVQGGYQFREQVVIGQRLGVGKHKIDFLVTVPDGDQIPVSCKWQQSSGTAEQKVPYEVICLANAVHSSRGRYKKAYLVLGGEGWSLKTFYLDNGLGRYLQNCEVVDVISLERFIGKANKGRL